MFESDDLLPSSSLRDRRRELTVSAILEAAWGIAHEHGLASLSLRELGRRVGLGASSIYQYFPSKHAIYDAMFADGHRQLQRHMAELDRNGDPEDVFRAGSRMFSEWCVADPIRYQLLFQRTLPGFEPSESSMAEAWRSYQDKIDVLAALGVDDPDDLDLLRALQMGLTDQQIANDPGGDRWLRLNDRAIDMFLDHAIESRTSKQLRRRRSKR